jgi:hypothetical protein
MSLNGMRVLLLHPEDDPENGPWGRERWDRVVDLGFAGEQTRARWRQKLDCAVERIPNFDIQDFAVVRRALSSGFGFVVDEHGLDWWDLISVRFHEQIALICRLEKLAPRLGRNDRIFVTRPGLHVSALSVLLNRRIDCFRQRISYFERTRRVVETARKFNLAQLVEIAGDKYDAGYRLRRFAAHGQTKSESAVVLLPVAQGNAARTAAAYAAMLPDQKFLLVATRQSGFITEHPSNISVAKLASYASGKRSAGEFQDLLTRWRQIEAGAVRNSEISLLKSAGAFSGIEKTLRNGLAIRDAWLSVFDREQVSAVLCTDDTNPYTHIPLLIAQKRGLPTIACHHGALDGGYLVKRGHTGVVLAKGRMENDYLVNTCGLPEERIEIGAPALPRMNAKRKAAKRSIIFFSEPYALAGGRCGEFYRELLPPLADLASRMKLELVVKLHPMESVSERQEFINRGLPLTQQKKVRVVDGVLSEELLNSASFGVTLRSTAAVDCAIRGIPVFLCAWLDDSYCGYVDQFVSFRVGVRLNSPSEVASIPEILENFSPAYIRDLWDTISPNRLRELLAAPLKMAAAV